MARELIVKVTGTDAEALYSAWCKKTGKVELRTDYLRTEGNRQAAVGGIAIDLDTFVARLAKAKEVK